MWVLDEEGEGGLVRLGSDEVVHLYSHCSYVFLHVPRRGGEARAYFWQGSRAAGSDWLMWALHLRSEHCMGEEWVGLLGGDRFVRHERVRQGREPTGFHALVCPRAFVVHDRVFRRREGGSRTCLYRVHAPMTGEAISVAQVEAEARSLHSRDAFICLRVLTAGTATLPPALDGGLGAGVWFWVRGTWRFMMP